MAKALKKAERAASCLKGHKFVEVSSFGDLRFGTCKKCGSKMWGSRKETEDGDLYSKEELDKIDKIRLSNDKMEEFFKEKREQWSKNTDPIFETIKHSLTPSDFKGVVEAQALCLSYRQSLNEEIAYFLNRRSREEIKLKALKQEKFLFYSTGFGLKTNMSEKTILIDAHTSENERTMQIIETHIEHLRDTVKSLESFQYSIKNLVSLYEYLGK